MPAFFILKLNFLTVSFLKISVSFFKIHKKKGAYPSPTSMLVPFLNRNVICPSLCTVAVSRMLTQSSSSHSSITSGFSTNSEKKIRSSRSRFIRPSRSCVTSVSRLLAFSYLLTRELYFYHSLTATALSRRFLLSTD